MKNIDMNIKYYPKMRNFVRFKIFGMIRKNVINNFFNYFKSIIGSYFNEFELFRTGFNSRIVRTVRTVRTIRTSSNMSELYVSGSNRFDHVRAHP